MAKVCSLIASGLLDSAKQRDIFRFLRNNGQAQLPFKNNNQQTILSRMTDSITLLKDDYDQVL